MFRRLFLCSGVLLAVACSSDDPLAEPPTSTVTTTTAIDSPRTDPVLTTEQATTQIDPVPQSGPSTTTTVPAVVGADDQWNCVHGVSNVAGTTLDYLTFATATNDGIVVETTITRTETIDSVTVEGDDTVVITSGANTITNDLPGVGPQTGQIATESSIRCGSDGALTVDFDRSEGDGVAITYFGFPSPESQLNGEVGQDVSRFEITEVEPATVTVEAGTFDAVRYVLEGSGGLDGQFAQRTELWLAEGLGVVRAVSNIDAGDDGVVDSELRLLAVTAP